MEKVNAVITGVHAWVPEYKLTNDELATMVDTSDEWIMQRIGIKERRILKDKNTGSSYMGAKAVEGLLKKTGTDPSEVDLIIATGVTPDMWFPCNANIIADLVGIKNGFGFDINAACSGFIYTLQTAAMYIESGKYKKIVVVGTDKMSAITDYTDRTTCPLFGDAAAAVLIEPTAEPLGIMDHIFGVDGSGRKHLYMKAGGSARPASHETVDAKEHFIYQDGKAVFKFAVIKMAEVAVEMMEKHHLTPDNLAYLVPHQANMRIDRKSTRLNSSHTDISRMPSSA